MAAPHVAFFASPLPCKSSNALQHGATGMSCAAAGGMLPHVHLFGPQPPLHVNFLLVLVKKNTNYFSETKSSAAIGWPRRCVNSHLHSTWLRKLRSEIKSRPLIRVVHAWEKRNLEICSDSFMYFKFDVCRSVPYYC